MANIKSLEDIERERIETVQKRTGNYPIHRDRLALLYCRYSSAEQVKQSVSKGLEQWEKMQSLADDHQWPRDKRLVFIENKIAENGRIKSVSGTLPIEVRAKLKTIVEEYVNKDLAGALFCDDISRLTRAADLDDAVTLAKACRKHEVVIITTERMYDFRRSGDFDAFIDDVKAAARWLETHLRGKMLKNRQRKAEKGELANGVAPIGLMVDETGNNLMPSPHAERVNWVYARFRAHNASLNDTLREILAMAKRGEPLFPDVEGLDTSGIHCTRMNGGWTIASRSGLQYLLTCPQYQGHLMFGGVVIRYNAFPAIVDADNWTFAFEHLSKHNLDNTPIQRERKAVRYSLDTAKEPNTALLAGTRHDGRPIIDGVNGSHVYIQTSNSTYVVRRFSGVQTPNVTGYESSIKIADLDSIFEKNLLIWLEKSERAACAMNADEVPMSQLSELAYSVDQTTPTSTWEENKLEEVNANIARVQFDLDAASAVMDVETRREKYALLASYKDKRNKLLQAQEHQARIQRELEQAQRDAKNANSLWKKWDLEEKRRFIRLSTSSITLEEIADGWLRLTVEWSPILGSSVQHCYIWRSVGSEWTPEEIAILESNYATASRDDLLHMLPNRSWLAIMRQAIPRKIRRTVSREPRTMSPNLSMRDLEVLEKYGVEPHKPVQWVNGEVRSHDGKSIVSHERLRGSFYLV